MHATNLHFHEWGDRGRETLVFLHGFMGSGADWRTVAGLLGSRYHMLAPDLPGHGRSHCADPQAFTMANAAVRVLALLDKLEIEQCRLVGYSMGGRLALYLACFYPARFTHLLLESSSPGIRDAAARAVRRRWDAAIADKLVTQPLDQFLDQWYAMPLFASLRKHPDFADVLAARRRNDPQQLALSMRMMGTGSQPSLWEAWARLAVPTRLVVGALDGKYVGVSREMVEAVDRQDAESPRVEGDRIVLAGVGHNVHFEDSGGFVGVVDCEDAEPPREEG